MSASQALQEKHRRILESISTFENHVLPQLKECSKSYDNDCSKFKNEFEMLNRSMENEQEKIDDLHTIHRKQQEQAVEHETKVDEMRKELKTLTIDNKHILPNEISKIENENRDKCFQLKKMENELNIMILKNERKISLLEQQCDLYQKYLAMKFTVVNGNCWRIIFNNINPNNVNQEFYVTLDIENKHNINIVDCHPKLNSIDSLAKQLCQREIKLSQFVIIVRQQFRKLFSRPSGRYGIS